MKAFTKQSLFALVAVALLSACSRPYATFQKTTPEHFYTKATVTPVETPATDVPAAIAETPVVAETSATRTAEAAAPATPAKVDAELQKVEALVSAKAGLAANKKLTRNLTRAKQMVTEMRANVAKPASAVGETSATVAPQKLNLAQRLVMKSIDKKIHNKMAPKKPMAKSLVTIGLVVALIGLLLILVSNGGGVAALGGLGLLVGLVLIIIGLLQ